MSIIPAGNRREQVAQGALKNQSFFDNDLFKKIAVDIGGLVDNPAKSKQPQPGQDFGLGDSQSRLNTQDNIPGADSGQTGEPGEQFDPSNPNPSSPQGVQPAGTGLSPFLQMTPQEPAQEQQSPILNQMEQIEQMLQGSGFGFDLQQKGSGKYVIQLIPMQGAMMPRDHYKKILNNLGQLGFNATGAKLPANDPSNEPLYMEYTLGSDKVMKSGT